MSGTAWVPVLSISMFVLVVASVRVIGLRSFSKMSSFDFAVTVSIGSILGAVATSSTPLLNGALAITTLLFVQAAVAWFRTRRRAVERVIDNTPMLLMDGPEIRPDNLDRARVTRSDVMAKLRQANVARLSDVRAVVLETTGDISVIHGPHAVDEELLEGLRGR